MIYSIDDVVVGVTRVRSLCTGWLGTISYANKEEPGNPKSPRYDEIGIDWDNGNKSSCWIDYETINIEIVQMDKVDN